MSIKKIVIFTVLLSLTGISMTFAKENDFGVWLDYSAVKKIRSATIGILGEFYTRENSSKIDRISIGIKGDYQIFPWLSAGAGNTLVNFNRVGYQELADRLYVQAEPSWHKANFYFSFRERMQVTFFPETRTNSANSYYWRNRFEMVYKHKSSKVDPLIDLETLYHLGNTNHNPSQGYRITLGANYHPTSNQRIKFYGMLTDGTIVCRYILGVSYEIRL